MKPLHSLTSLYCLFCWIHPGPPDVEQPCEPSLQAWSPELSLYDTNLTSPCPDTEGCALTLRFLHHVVPHALTLWVTYISSSKCQSRTNVCITYSKPKSKFNKSTDMLMPFECVCGQAPPLLTNIYTSKQ